MTRSYLIVLALLTGTLLETACSNTRTGDMNLSSGDSTGTVAQLQIMNLAYISTSGGTTLMVAGDAPSGGLSFIDVTFLDAAGIPVEVDTNGDGVADSTTMHVPATQYVTGQTFFAQLSLSKSAATTAPSVSAQAVDQDGNLSNTDIADLNRLPQLDLDAPCDMRGFDACPDGSTCRQTANDWQARCIGDTAS